MLSIRLTVSLLVAAMIAAVLVVVLAPQAVAQPTIKWDPEKIEIEVEAGTEVSHSVRYQASGAISNGSFLVTPSLYPVLALGSAAPAQELNQFADLELFFVATSGARVGDVFSGTIHIRDGARTLAQPLPIRVTVIERQGTKSASDSLNQVSLEIPATWIARSELSQVSLYFNEARRQSGVPPNIYLEVVDIADEIASGLSELELYRAAMEKSGAEIQYIISEVPDYRGLRIEVAEFGRFRYVVLDEARSGKAVVFVTGDEPEFFTPAFRNALSSLDFK